jgi:hypothetical protein
MVTVGKFVKSNSESGGIGKGRREKRVFNGATTTPYDLN